MAQVALHLLEDLMANDSANFREGTALIHSIHLARSIIPDESWDFSPRANARFTTSGNRLCHLPSLSCRSLRRITSS